MASRASISPRWPNGAKACISITLDNMGEAADINRGLIPESDPVGDHHSVKVELPKMLDLLDKYNVKGTYYIEGWNCDVMKPQWVSKSSPAMLTIAKVYPDAMHDVSSRGHEIAFHAFQHEVWSTLSRKDEISNLNRSIAAAKSIGIKYKGFRPPGGMITPQTLRLLRENDMTYLSPAAKSPAVVDGIAMVPFQWESIDAYFYMHETAPLRHGLGDSKEPLSEDVMEERLLKRIDGVIAEGGYLAFLFHPFLTVSERRLTVMEKVVQKVTQCQKEGTVWVSQAGEAAEWIREREDIFGNDPVWDDAKWKMK
jgi:peptidoglycan/xylan/chitin deacetylase (PgdA/CDA1 family)